MRHQPLDVRVLLRCLAGHQAGDRHRRVIAVPHVRGADARHQLDAPVGFVRMGIDDRFAPIQLGEDRIELLVAEIRRADARAHAEAGRLERVGGVLDLLQAAVDVGLRNDGEQPEVPFRVAADARAVLVGLTRQVPHQVAGVDVHALFGQPRGAGEVGRGRLVGQVDPVFLHPLDRDLRRPLSTRQRFAVELRHADAVRVEELRQSRRLVVVMEVDAARHRRRLRGGRLRTRQHGPRRHGGQPGQKLASVGQLVGHALRPFNQILADRHAQTGTGRHLHVAVLLEDGRALEHRPAGKDVGDRRFVDELDDRRVRP